MRGQQLDVMLVVAIVPVGQPSWVERLRASWGTRGVMELLKFLRLRLPRPIWVLFVLSIIAAGVLCLRNPVCGELLLEDLEREAVLERWRQIEEYMRRFRPWRPEPTEPELFEPIEPVPPEPLF